MAVRGDVQPSTLLRPPIEDGSVRNAERDQQGKNARGDAKSKRIIAADVFLLLLVEPTSR